MGIVKIFKGLYHVAKDLIQEAAKEFVEAAEDARLAEQAKPRAREYIESVEVHVGPCTTVTRYKWCSATGEVIGWYSKEELQTLRANYIEFAHLPLAPGVADEIRRVVATIDDVLGDEVVPPPTPL